jgi:hypothetical protein
MGLDDPVFIPVAKPKQASVLNRGSQELIDVRSGELQRTYPRSVRFAGFDKLRESMLPG